MRDAGAEVSIYRAIDLHPDGYDGSTVLDTNGTRQAGSVYELKGFNVTRHTAAWAGSAGSFVNLHEFLPAGYQGSFACGVDPAGNVYGGAWTRDGIEHWFVWRPVPEPAVGLFPVALAVAALRRRRT